MKSLIECLIRPYRFTYSFADLGPPITQTFVRHDGYLLNVRQLKLHYSYYENSLNHSEICIIYAHCNSGCKIEGLQYIPYFMESGWNCLLFDFSGSGLSQGFYQAEDLESMAKEAKSRGNQKLLFWGRSMGAATIIFFLAQTKLREDVVACVLDSPYSSLWRLIIQIGQSRFGFPQFIVQRLADVLRKEIIDTEYFDLKKLEPLQQMSGFCIPICYITSQKDDFVNIKHVKDLYTSTRSVDKKIYFMDRQHNSTMSEEAIINGVAYLKRILSQNFRKLRKIRLFTKNKLGINGNNMAEMILQKGKRPLKKIKSLSLLKRKESNPCYFPSELLMKCKDISTKHTEISIYQTELSIQQTENSTKQAQMPERPREQITQGLKKKRQIRKITVNKSFGHRHDKENKKLKNDPKICLKEKMSSSLYAHRRSSNQNSRNKENIHQLSNASISLKRVSQFAEVRIVRPSKIKAQ